MMQGLWRVWAVSVVVAFVVVGEAHGEERYVVGASRKISSIPGYVAPTTATSTTTTTTPSPPITTFRPNFLAARRPLSGFTRASANPFLMRPFSPFVVPVRAPRPAPDGTTKSRVTTDTAFDGGAVLDEGDKYTTLDRLQSERGAPPPLPRPQKHQLGGLHPDEVYYADDDLLIIKGGGFHTEAFKEPLQPLGEDDEGDVLEGSPTRVAPVVAPPPSPHQEYNGNIPSIVPPPSQPQDLPFSLFVEGASKDNYIMIPYVLPNTRSFRGTSMVHVPYVYPVPHPEVTFRYSSPAVLQAVTPLKLPHSLEGDTDVNYSHRRPPINPDAELLVHHPSYTHPRPRSRPRL